MKHTIKIALVAALVCAGGAHAQDVGFGLRLGTLGLGAEVGANLLPGINARVGLNGLTVDYEGTEGDIDYDFSFKLFSASALVDWHAFGGGFRLSGGLLFNGNEIEADAEPSTSYTIGDQVYTGDQVGNLKGTLDFNAIAPYLGVGWGNIVGDNRNLGIVLDLGLALQGTPTVDMRVSGLVASDPDFQADLAREESELEDDLEDFGVYPVLAVGLRYRF